MKKNISSILILAKVKLILIVLFFLYTAKSYSQPVYKYPPTGKQVDAGGHMLNIHAMGKGKPVVIFENGSADFSFIWDLVQPEISKTTRTVSYDRAGYAWSEEGPVPRTGRQIAYELHTALHNAGINGPYIMVGQSYGGFLVRYFARCYRKEVAGMVLVDALNENSKIIMNNKGVRIREMATGRKAPPVQTTKKNIDTDSKKANPLAANTNLEPPLDKLPVYDQKLQLWAQTQFNYFKAVSSEMDWSPEDVQDMYENRNKPEYKLGNIPLIVISRGNGGYSGMADSAALENERLKLQGDLTHLSTNSKHIIDVNSGHNVHLEDPQTVIDAIKQVIRAYKTHTKFK